MKVGTDLGREQSPRDSCEDETEKNDLAVKGRTGFLRVENRHGHRIREQTSHLNPGIILAKPITFCML